MWQHHVHFVILVWPTSWTPAVVGLFVCLGIRDHDPILRNITSAFLRNIKSEFYQITPRVNFLAESQYRIYPNMCAKFGCSQTVVSKTSTMTSPALVLLFSPACLGD